MGKFHALSGDCLSICTLKQLIYIPLQNVNTINNFFWRRGEGIDLPKINHSPMFVLLFIVIVFALR